MHRLLLLALGLSTLASCETDDTIYITVPAETTDWLPDQHSQVITFATASGTTQTMEVERFKDKYNYTGKGVTVINSTEWQFARYKQQNSNNPGFSVGGHEFRLDFYLKEKPNASFVDNRTDELGGINTNDLSPYTLATASHSLKLRNNQLFGGHTYPALVTVDFLHVDTLSAPTTSTLVRKIYYAKNSGLVGYRTANGQLWLRQ